VTERHFAEVLFANGYTDLISVIPPGAQISPKSKINPTQAGKIPGRRNANGTWGGWDWLRHETTIDDVRQWAINDQASFGLRASRFPGVDVDCTDEALSKVITDFILSKLGPAPIRVGRAPKKLLMYRTDKPFGRMRLWIKTSSGEHLVEILGLGQQYLVHGLHPATQLPYKWLTPPVAAAGLTPITREQADAALDELAATLDALGMGFCRREADGRATERSNVQQDVLLAPSIERLREAVALIPNDNNVYATRTDYLKMGYAIKAAAGDDADLEGLEIFSEWAARWDGGSNDPEVVLADWRRMTGAKSVGWNWIAEQARGWGFDDTSDDFEVLQQDDARDRRDAPEAAPTYSDQWLADEVIKQQIARLRYVPERGCFLVWEGGRWKVDAELLAENLINESLRSLSQVLVRSGVSPAEIKENLKNARILCSAGKAASVSTVLRSNRSMAVSVVTLDHDPMILNTPNGVVTLADGKLLPPDPAMLCTKRTAVAPDFAGSCPTWLRFLHETTQGNEQLVGYLQRFAGYSLTGLTREQQFTFIWGDGKNGKSVFLNVLQGILGDYARVATMDTFTASNNERHSTDIASLHGARLVTASETTLGKRWDEARVKNLTGGEPVTARFMRQDNFTFTPQFKLIFIGNFKPELRSVGPAMERRMHLVPFTNKVKTEDPALGEKLRAEWPAILAWMIAGCLAWQGVGLTPPEIVRATTADYFAGEDSTGDWLRDRVGQDPSRHATSEELFQSWREWAGRTGEYVGTKKRLSSALVARGLPRWQDPKTRVMGFDGVYLLSRDALENIG
jgi:P4 family phage/plasmid primase-like protien